MSLIEQRASYMSRLQTLIDTRQKDIDEKVKARREQLEAEYVQPYRAELEAQKVTPEITQLVDFVNQIDAMLAYENTHADVSAESIKHAETIEQVNEVEAKANTSVETKEVDEEMETFHEDAHDNTAGHDAVGDVRHDATPKTAEELVCSGFEAIAADLADTRAKLQSANSGRPGMPGIVLPRR